MKDKRGHLVRNTRFPKNTLGRVSRTQSRGPGLPDFLHLNDEDFDFVRVKLDPRSIETLKSSLSKIDEPFAGEWLGGVYGTPFAMAKLHPRLGTYRHPAPSQGR